MKKIKVILERSKDGFSAYGETMDGIWGMGETIHEAKASANESLKLFMENNTPENIPNEFKEPFELVFKFEQ